jgi:hypothetical protein
LLKEEAEMTRKLKKEILLMGVICLAFAVSGLAAEYEQLTALLHDLKGWKADPAQGMAMDMGPTKMINATRQYQKGAAEITALLMKGNQAMAQGSMQAMKAENGSGKVRLSTIDGFKVQSFYDKAENSGAVVVLLSQHENQGAIFTLGYEGLSEKQGLEMARKFDWKKMKIAVDKLF